MLVQPLPLGTVITAVTWLNTPEGGGGTARFAVRADAVNRASPALVNVEVVLAPPDGDHVVMRAGGPSVGPTWKASDHQEPGVLPQAGAALVLVEQADGAPETSVFRTRDGQHFVLYFTGRV
ncbi:hypothetical protein AB0K00_49070 [Dactylosporangium sp. NPDC049525]|uniref:hypothetical protein n=1 Tax=Dactylosporangium sp. NPDC049525 TaxID=3154730 RepID=UPI0034435415